MPHSTKAIEDAVAWGLETSPETLIATQVRDFNGATAQSLSGQIRCPVLIIQGTDDAITGASRGVALAEATGGKLTMLAGSGHLPQVRDPVKMINVYGYAYCGILGPTMAGVCQDMGMGPARSLALPGWLSTSVELIPGVYYPTYRLAIIVTTLAVALFLYVVVMRTRVGMLIRAGASNREMVGALGIDIKLLYTLVFGLGAALAGLAGLMQAPILTVQIGMGENILILAFVVIVIGGIGSIRGAFIAAVFVGLVDTVGRAFLPDLLRLVLSTSAASTAARALSSMLIYLLMAIVLVVRPAGLFPAPGR